MLTANEIRKTFLDFFESKKHKIVRSAPVVPIDDPTLLFSNAGMNQFKNIFLGVEKPEAYRIADTQKCIRVSGKHNDLEEVGKDTYHHTLFEMLGNWSFGDYFKREAIQWAWELLTDVWKIPKERLYVTVFEGNLEEGLLPDEEAEKLWKEVTDINPNHVLRFGKKDNFWEMGDIGPCGPCSEIHIDLTEDLSGKKLVNADDPRVIEIWNLVFIQYNREQNGKLNQLPAKHVDTGMGFERLVAVLQGVESNYDTDVFQPLIKAIEELTGIEYASYDGAAHRVIADHVRALSFAIADGALPSNEGRGYVLRRILRRASRYGRKLNVHEPFIFKLVPVLADSMGDIFPELIEKTQYVSMVIKAEEEGFNNTLDRGIEIFERISQDIQKKGENVFPGDAIFLLYDTYGFPVDLTRLMAEEKQLTVDMDGFNLAMEEQRQRAKEAHQTRFEVREFFKNGKEEMNSDFVGYSELQSEVKIVAFHENEFLLDRTPFYGESGGQIGDKGVVYDPSGSFRVKVVDALKSANRIIHVGELESGDFKDVNGKQLIAEIDGKLRKSTARNHTATHILHKALKAVLGEHVNQAGSLVTPERLRFDLTHFEKISASQLDKIEEIVNEHIRRNHLVTALSRSYDEAKEMGAVALFGEKYGDVVRIIKIDDYSMELCGGTHLEATGEIGYFRIVSESSVAAGVRRIEAITGELADQTVRKEKRDLLALREVLSISNGDLIEKTEHLIDERKQLLKELSDLKLKLTSNSIESLLDKAESIDNFKLVTSRLNNINSIEEMKKTGDLVRTKLKNGIGVLGSIINDKPFLLCVVTEGLIQSKKLKADEIIKILAKHINGGGGGKPHMAQAGGKDSSKLDLALKKAKETIESIL